ncbi:MAG TPA: glycosyltransferase family 2 protein [Blastocatellia bacterium]|jgi:glycosyltransferase involved in cell wall biosynthesis|nr:glycosyltransferase family 2 protein [Blastocatellia bacterium]
MSKKPGISVFFPAYNDAGTIASLVVLADRTLRKLTDDYEIIVVNDGSADHTAQVLSELEGVYPRLRVIHHPTNLGYGSALRTGFESATRDLIFYTDGDAQYDVRELERLLPLMADDVDIVNGYKISRSDPFHRTVIGKIYCWIIKLAFMIKIRDVDCDFRLVRRASYKRVRLYSTSGTICVEMIKSFQDAGLRFAECPVHHYHRAYGKSQFFNFKRLFKTFRDLSRLWWRLVVKRQAQLAPVEENSRGAIRASDDKQEK